MFENVAEMPRHVLLVCGASFRHVNSDGLIHHQLSGVLREEKNDYGGSLVEMCCNSVMYTVNFDA